MHDHYTGVIEEVVGVKEEILKEGGIAKYIQDVKVSTNGQEFIVKGIETLATKSNKGTSIHFKVSKFDRDKCELDKDYSGIKTYCIWVLGSLLGVYNLTVRKKKQG